MRLDSRYRSYQIVGGTLDVDDLVYKCFGFLSSQKLDRETIERTAKAEQNLLEAVYLKDANEGHEQKMEVLVDEIFDILEDISPKDCFFGLHPGDPGRIGFWPNSLR
jgi:hypothetical protein